MIDCHIHLLPNLDDGADSLDEALGMIFDAVDSGVRKIIVTPHYNQHYKDNFNGQKLNDEFKKFKQILKNKFPNLEIYLGMEIYAFDDLVDKIKNNLVIGLNNSRYYLVEFPFNTSLSEIEKRIKQMRAINKIMIIAHPERYHVVQKEPWIVYEWLKLGCLIQLNKDSIFGMFGMRAKETAHKLLKYNLVTLVASDGHDSVFRHARMDEIQDYLELNYGLSYSQKLLYYHPLAIINDDDISFKE